MLPPSTQFLGARINACASRQREGDSLYIGFESLHMMPRPVHPLDRVPTMLCGPEIGDLQFPGGDDLVKSPRGYPPPFGP